MGIKRIGKHLLEHRWRVRRIFTPAVLAAIEQAIKAGEATHSGQIRFVVEGALDGAHGEVELGGELGGTAALGRTLKR